MKFAAQYWTFRFIFRTNEADKTSSSLQSRQSKWRACTTDALKRTKVKVANRRFLAGFPLPLDKICRWVVLCRPSTSIGTRPSAVIPLFEFRAAAAIPATFTRFFLAAGFSNAIACAFFSRHGFLSYSRNFQLYRPTPWAEWRPLRGLIGKSSRGLLFQTSLCRVRQEFWDAARQLTRRCCSNHTSTLCSAMIRIGTNYIQAKDDWTRQVPWKNLLFFEF